MNTTGPTADDHAAGQYEATQYQWTQPSFGQAAPPTVSGSVLPAASWTGPGRTVAVPTADEARLRTVLKLVWPVALVVAITTGHWVPLLIAALVVNAVVRRRLIELRYHRLTAAASLR